MAGTARRNENRGAQLRSRPAPSAEAMVTPDRERPGNTASPWARPMSAACRQVVSRSSRAPAGQPPGETHDDAGDDQGDPDPQRAKKGRFGDVLDRKGDDRSGDGAERSGDRGAAVLRGWSSNAGSRLVRYQTTAPAVPTWSMASKTTPGCEKPGISICARARCPDDDTGRNSVSPWRTPSSTATPRLMRLDPKACARTDRGHTRRSGKNLCISREFYHLDGSAW